MDNKKVYIKNISNHTIIVVEPSIRLRTQLRPMAHFPVKAEDFDIQVARRDVPSDIITI